MTVLDIYNLALSVFKEPPVTEVELENKSGHNIEVLSLFYQPALLKARDEYSWSWLEDVIELSEIEQKIKGYDYSYQLPQGQIKITEIIPRNVEYRKIGNKLYSKQAIDTVIGIKTDTITPDNLNIPEEFWILVSYAMAFLASESMSNNDQVMIQVVSSKYNSYLEQMKLTDAMTGIRNICQIE